MVNVSSDAKPIKNIKMADSNTPIGKDRSHLCFYLRPLPCSSVSCVTQESLAFPAHTSLTFTIVGRNLFLSKLSGQSDS